MSVRRPPLWVSLPQHAHVGESLKVGAGLTEPAPDVFDVANFEALSDKRVEVDGAFGPRPRLLLRR